MKPQTPLAALLLAAGALAAPSWGWKDDTRVEQYFHVDGGDVLFCKSGWEAVGHAEHGLALLHNKREAEAEPTLDLLKKLLDKLLNKIKTLLSQLTKLKYELSKCKKDWEDWKKVCLSCCPRSRIAALNMVLRTCADRLCAS